MEIASTFLLRRVGVSLRLTLISLRLIFIGITAMTYQTEQLQAETALGYSNPTLSLNLADGLDYGVGMQFIDQMHTMRPWIGHETGWGGMDLAELQAGGYLDEDGWPTSIPEGYAKIGTVFGWSDTANTAEAHTGRYVIKYEGEGEIQLAGGINVISQEDGRIVVDNPTGDKWFLNIVETDPNGTGNNIRNISVVHEDHVALHEAGALFNPDWLELVQDARELRFLNWIGANGSKVETWDDMPSATGPNMGNGMPIEYMVQLANETGTDPWFTIPHLADDDYIRKFAEYVRDNLDPALTARVEYSNETWNWNFSQTGWLRDQSVEEWGVKAHRDYYVKKATETMLIWDEVYQGEPDGRLTKVLGTHTEIPWYAEQMMNPKIWRENEPDTFVEPSTVFDELAVTTYFGGPTTRLEDQRTALLEAIRDPDVDAVAYLAEQMMDPTVKGSIPHIANRLAENAAIAEANGMVLTSYEGGQHIHQKFKAPELTSEEILELSSWVGEFVRTPEMGALYQELWDVWAAIGDGSFMQFSDVGSASQYGSWGLYNGLEDSTARSDVLEQKNAVTEAWWGDAGGEHYQQGKIVNGTDAAETLIGTSQEDYLLGGGGDDYFIGGRGNDGINGGAGTDRLILQGDITDYTMRLEGDGLRLTGPDGSDFLINMEELEFDDSQLVILADLVANSDGSVNLDGTVTEIPTVLPGVVVDPDPEVTPTPDPDPVPRPATGETGQLKAGNIIDGSSYEKVTVDDFAGQSNGVKIKAIKDGSELADKLDLDAGSATPAYISFANGSGKIVDTFVSSLGAATAQPTVNDYDGDEGLELGAIITNAPRIIATDGDDLFRGADANDDINGNKGRDELHGGGGNDILRGAGGDDVMFGNRGSDKISAGWGNDMLDGGIGDDRLHGRNHEDVLFGGSGSDWISGGTENDQMTGGEGNDRFVFNAGDGRDFIMDFSQDDRLVLRDFFEEGANVADHAGMKNGTLYLSNGEDRITLMGLDMDDLDWVVDNII